MVYMHIHVRAHTHQHSRGDWLKKARLRWCPQDSVSPSLPSIFICVAFLSHNPMPEGTAGSVSSLAPQWGCSFVLSSKIGWNDECECDRGGNGSQTPVCRGSASVPEIIKAAPVTAEGKKQGAKERRGFRVKVPVTNPRAAWEMEPHPGKLGLPA